MGKAPGGGRCGIQEPPPLSAGELSEKQKVELEEKRGLVQSQARELGLLREKLAETSRRLAQRESHLQATTEELR